MWAGGRLGGEVEKRKAGSNALHVSSQPGSFPNLTGPEASRTHAGCGSPGRPDKREEEVERRGEGGWQTESEWGERLPSSDTLS